MPGRSHSGPLPDLTGNLVTLRENLRFHVLALCNLGERNRNEPQALIGAEAYITAAFNQAGYVVRRHEFDCQGMAMANLEVERKGTKSPDRIIVIGAHYDTVYSSPGADDNASGIAALLELARLLSTDPPACSVRFVAFANEEHPGGPDTDMGSYHYAQRCNEGKENLVGMLSLEMLGYYSSTPGSQRYPEPFSYFYPSVGNFIGFVGNAFSRTLVRNCVESFRRHASFPCEGVAAPDSVKDISRSDHWSFWQFGYPALMVTDTSNFRNPHYHSAQDLPETLDYDALARVTSGLAKVPEELSSNPSSSNALESDR